jgi:anti-sigma B factor antagonist
VGEFSYVAAVTPEPIGESLRPRGPVQFGLREHCGKDGTVLAVEGELDILTAPKLGARLNGFVRRGSTDVVLDLRSALFIDSLALSILLNARRRLERRGCRMTVLCDEGPVRRVIEMARLEAALGIASSPAGRTTEYE